MALHLSAPSASELKPRIIVFGVGGGGCNAVNNMIEAGLEGVEFVVANTDAQQLISARTDKRIQLGAAITRGLGAGANPEVGMSAAQESIDEINALLDGADMVFVCAGMGGGTGTGAAPIVAKCARERGILTVGVVTKPFMFEGRPRQRIADHGIAELQRYVDTLIIIPNQNLFRIASAQTTLSEAFGKADQVLHEGVRSITDLMVLPGLINLDFADVRTVMAEMGKAMMGTGEAAGDDRAVVAAQAAIQNPLLDETSLKGAQAVLINVTGGHDMTLLEVDEAANVISSEVDPDANIIFGAAFDDSLQGVSRGSVVATGMDGSAGQRGSGTGGYGQGVHDAPRVQEPRLETRSQYAAARAASLSSPAQPAAQPVASAPQPAVAPQVHAQVQAPVSSHEPAPALSSASVVQTASLVPVAETRSEPVIVRAPEVEPRRDLSPRYEPRAEAPRPAPAPQPEVSLTAAAEPTYAQPQQKQGGWRSLFGGRPRYDAQPQVPPIPSRAAQAQTQGQAQAQVQASQDAQVQARSQSQLAPERAPEPEDDLEIPSFLRRLAN